MDDEPGMIDHHWFGERKGLKMTRSLSRNEPDVKSLGVVDGDCMGGCMLFVLVMKTVVACVR